MDWQLVLTGTAGALVTALLGVLAYVLVPKKDIGTLAKSSVEAADIANDLLRESIEDLQTDVALLKTALIEKEDKIIRLEKEIILLERWIAVLMEQIAQTNVIPITLDEIRQKDK